MNEKSENDIQKSKFHKMLNKKLPEARTIRITLQSKPESVFKKIHKEVTK